MIKTILWDIRTNEKLIGDDRKIRKENGYKYIEKLAEDNSIINVIENDDNLVIFLEDGII